MTTAHWFASVLGTIVLITGVRLWQQARTSARSIGMRLALLALHAGGALLFFLLLFPPALQAPSPCSRC